MGNFHCVSKGCAEVVYRPYESARVRWRYPGEQWQQVEADDYTIDNLPGQCCYSYDVTVSYEIAHCKGGVAYADTATVRIPNAIYKGVDYKIKTEFVKTEIVVDYFDCIQNKLKEKSVWGSSAKSDPEILCTDKYATYSKGSSKWELINLVRADGQPDDCKTCKFIVYKNGKIVFENERSECPEVEQLPCQLSDETKVIKIKKFPFLDRIEVVDYFYDVKYGLITDSNNYGLLLSKEHIPDNCLNIYRNSTTTLIPSNFVFITNTSEQEFNFIEQICSAKDCPPPEYEVICNCNEECPLGTCPVKCGNTICCYDLDTGISVKEILIGGSL